MVGIAPEYIYQASRYRASDYAKEIRHTLEHRDELRAILDEFRTEPLPSNWWPVSVFSGFTDKDTTTVIDWDGEWKVTYRDDETQQTETVDLRETSLVKLPWRLDWPMRWAREHVDFEPAGKDHHSEGGSFDTSRKIVRVYGAEAPVSFQYDFISIKGRGGKISSSSGEVISLADVLEVYLPEVTRYLFASTRPNTEFSISFDLDVLKIYEDYDTCERIYFGLQEANEKRTAKEKRIYELSQVGDIPSEAGYQIPFRHLCNLLQIQVGDVDAVVDSLPGITEGQKARLKARAVCAWKWITTFSPEEFRWTLSTEGTPLIDLSDVERTAIHGLRDLVSIMDDLDDKVFTERLYDVAKSNGLETADFFKMVYMVIINGERGPKLAGFIRNCGKERILPILQRY